MVADELSRTPGERASLAELRRLAGELGGPLERHSVRVYLLSLELAELYSLRVDREVLLCGALLHDVGLLPGAATADSYVRDGRRVAEEVLAPKGWVSARLRLVGDLIENHHRLRLQLHRGAEVELVRRADQIELSEGLRRFHLSRRTVSGIHRRVDGQGFRRQLLQLILRLLRDRPATIPRIFVPR